MRVLAVIAIMLLAVTAAGAADFHGARGGHFVAHYDPIGRPAGQIFTYDWEPGVVVRAYWLRPWRDRHYFPYGRDRWDVHRVSSHPVRLRPAEPFKRFWGVSSGFDPQPAYWPAPRLGPPATIHDK